MGNNAPDDLISVRKAARILGVHYGTLYRWIWSGKLPSWDLCGLVRVSEADARGLLKRKPVKATAAKPATLRQQARMEAWADEVLRLRGY
jgi:excisionase family DNA binding protein